MEPIRIESPFDKNDFIKASKVRWIIHWKKNKKQLIQYWIISIIIYSLGLILLTENEPSNPFVFIGIGFLVATVWLTYIRIYSWISTNKKTKLIAEKFNEIKMDCVYELSEDSIKYWDKEKHLDFKWSVFTHYSIYKDYIVMILNNSLINYYLFDKNETDIDKYNQILELVKTKLNYKEIK